MTDNNCPQNNPLHANNFVATDDKIIRKFENSKSYLNYFDFFQFFEHHKNYNKEDPKTHKHMYTPRIEIFDDGRTNGRLPDSSFLLKFVYRDKIRVVATPDNPVISLAQRIKEENDEEYIQESFFVRIDLNIKDYSLLVEGIMRPIKTEDNFCSFAKMDYTRLSLHRKEIFIMHTKWMQFLAKEYHSEYCAVGSKIEPFQGPKAHF